jgi:competence protein CoiA
MLCAKRKLTGEIVTAYLASKNDAPFLCPDCDEEVILKAGRQSADHFAHAVPLACQFSVGESDVHRYCKMEIYRALLKAPGVRDVAMEKALPFGRPDVSAMIRGVPVAIEVQISSLSIETIQRRTIEYGRNGIYVLWILQWRPELEDSRYRPSRWEKWLHAAYFGRVYYWVEGLTLVSYNFEPSFRSIPKSTWISKRGTKLTAGGYSRRLKSFRTAVRGPTFNFANVFVPRQRYWWTGNGVTVPDAKLFMDPGIGRHPPD